MKAILISPGAPGHLAIGDAPEPNPDSNEAVIAVRAVSVNRGEVRRAETMEAGATIGWDLAGVVETPAADGSGPPAGSSVVGFSQAMQGWAEQVAVPTRSLAVIPTGVSFADAATLPVAGLTALYGLERGHRLIGAKVLITGVSGGVGYFACQLAHLMGAQVYAPIRDPKHRQLALDAGANVVMTDCEPSSLTEQGPFRLVLDGVGGPQLGNLIAALDQDGRAVLYGVSGGPQTTLPIRTLMGTGAGRVDGFHLYRESEIVNAAEGLTRLLHLLACGKLKTLLARVDTWDAVGAVATALIQRTYLGKAVLTLPE